MTAFFSVEVDEEARADAASSSSSTRRRRSSRTRPTSAPRITSPAGSDAVPRSTPSSTPSRRASGGGRGGSPPFALCRRCASHAGTSSSPTRSSRSTTRSTRGISHSSPVAEVLARQTPVATDLRLVLGAPHAYIHMEQMADHCVTIAKLAKLSRPAWRRSGTSSSRWSTWATAASRWSSSLSTHFERDAELGEDAPRARRSHQPRELAWLRRRPALRERLRRRSSGA